ncbi:quinone-dependent dihydroorotate dehydrogenase [Saccharomonospora saliphila]|uniref:quinone-dependent dihydroorotate dehydrogenase n=1 Tax=Saccharomonospora saliphila TaxID=369829 RepID=UPI0003675266|nr:quinone-dependent dihydroorotate dehydrogenase [Saccharomonospora saliphila]
MFYDRIVRPGLYRLGGNDAEVVHERTLRALAGLSRLGPARRAARRHYGADAPVTVFGIRFPNRVGLAAGMDKDGRALAAWPALGFGFVELGTVTHRPQPGNPRPRLFALPDSDAVLNRMGFNNAGAEALAARLAAHGSREVPVGVSIGKSKVTPVADAIADYRACLRTVAPYADYVAVNVSSPNTPGLRTLQDRGALTELLAELARTAETRAAETGGSPVPVLVKLAPDLTTEAIAELLQVCLDHGVAGIIATNTTLARDGLAPTDAALAAEAGGLSGRPLTERAREVVRFVHRETGDRLPVIGVGGLGTPDDAVRMLDAGACLVQLYTGFALHGPGLVRGVHRAIAERQARQRALP